MKRIPEERRIQQINALPNIEFVRWADGYIGAFSKAVCRCAIDGFEWAAQVHSLINKGTGCPQCAGTLRHTEDEIIARINSRPNIKFVRWSAAYRNNKSRVVVCCIVDGFEWTVSASSLINGGYGCPQCAGQRRWTAEERIAQINALSSIEFVRWARAYKGAESKAVCRCAACGYEWAPAIASVINAGRGCPKCAEYGYNPAKAGTLYVLRSECGSMAKIGISNDYKRRHSELTRRTPFDWSCMELIHSDDGTLIAEWEKELHSFTEQAEFKEPFDGSTEWRKWDDRLPRWIKRFRARLGRYNKAPSRGLFYSPK